MKTSHVRSVTGQSTRAHPTRSRGHRDFLREYLADDERAVELLDAAFFDGNEGDIMYALRALARARGSIADIATSAGLSRETLYRTLSRSGNPRLSTLIAVMRAAGVRLKVEQVA